MDGSILTSIKNRLSVMEDDMCFDQELIGYINSAISVLTQIGVGPEEGFEIKGYDEQWGDFITDIVQMNMAEQYVGLKVRLLFDPPSNATASQYMQKEIEQLDWRLKVRAREG